MKPKEMVGFWMENVCCCFFFKPPRWRLTDLHLLTSLVSNGGYFLFPSLGMPPTHWPQPQTCVLLSRFSMSFHLMHTHTKSLTGTFTDHKARLKLKANFSAFQQSVSMLIRFILLFAVTGNETCLQFPLCGDVFVYAPCHCSWWRNPVSPSQLGSFGKTVSRNTNQD